MNTILVVYSDRKLTRVEANNKKMYSFRTKDDLQAGDRLDSPNYDTPMQVVKVLPEAYKYYNMQTGELSNAFNSTAQREVRELIIRDEDREAVYATRIEVDTEEDAV